MTYYSERVKGSPFLKFRHRLALGMLTFFGGIGAIIFFLAEDKMLKKIENVTDPRVAEWTKKKRVEFHSSLSGTIEERVRFKKETSKMPVDHTKQSVVTRA